MERAPLDRLTLNVALAGLVLTVIVFAIGGFGPAIGALAGAVVAVVNFVGLRWLVMRLIYGPERTRIATAVMLALKMAFVLAVIWILLGRAGLHPIGFAVGFSALFIGFAMAGKDILAPTGEEG
jgi:hypothetical protein